MSDTTEELRVFVIGDRVVFHCPGHYRHGNAGEILMVKPDRSEYMIGFDASDTFGGMWWTEPKYLRWEQK